MPQLVKGGKYVYGMSRVGATGNIVILPEAMQRYGYKDGGCINLPEKTKADYGLKPGDLLTVGRGSYMSIAFNAKGSIHEEAMKHPELEVFEG